MSNHLPEVRNAIHQILEHHRNAVQWAYKAYTKATAEATAANVIVKEVEGKITVEYRMPFVEEPAR